MAEKYSFFPDIEYTTFDWAKYFGSFIGNGVFPNSSTSLQVIANNDMTVTVKAGQAWINGYFYRNESDLILPIINADGVLKRKDNIVIRLDNAGNKINARVIKGTFTNAPIAPEVLRTVDFYDLKVAEIYVNAGAISIAQANITDTRLDSNVCGIVTQTVKTIDTTTLYSQIQADMAEFKADEQADFAEWSANSKQNLENFLKTIEGILSDDVAANLATEILARPKLTIIPQNTDIPIPDRTPNTIYLKITDTQSSGGGLPQSIKVSPNMGIKINASAAKRKSQSGISFE